MGLAAVDLAALGGGFGGLTAFSVRAGEDLTVVVEGPFATRVVDLEPLNRLEGWRRRYDVFTLPRGLRLTARWLTAGRLWLAQRIDDAGPPLPPDNAGLV